MLRRNVRLRKEYLLKRQLEDQENVIRERKRRVKEAVESGKPIAPEDREFELATRASRPLEDARSLAKIEAIDDEYTFSDNKEPRLLITTSRDPSSKLLQFAKEMKLVLPNAERINRGHYVLKDIVQMGVSNDVTDIVLIHEHKGQPDGLVLSHLPLGPTIYFSLSNVFLRHDLPTKPAPMSVTPPHLIFENLDSKLGQRVTRILRSIFPCPSTDAKRVLAFVNRSDSIHFRHFIWEDTRHASVKEKALQETKSASQIERDDSIDDKGQGDATRARKVAIAEQKSIAGIDLSEVGPRFVMRPYKIELGTLDMRDLEVEWSLRSFINKRREALAEDPSTAVSVA